MRPRKRNLALLAGLILLVWSVLFLPTYRYSFFWDDYHCIRPYSGEELLSTFHGWDDPDKVETPALRPIVVLLFAFQGSAFGENVILHRTFVTVMMWTLLFALGLLLAELQLNLVQIGAIFALFVFSRVCATLNLWIIQSSLILCYILMILVIFLLVRWIREGRVFHFCLMLLIALTAAFTREETYVLPVAALLIWALLPAYRSHWFRAIIAALSLLVIVTAHFWLRHVFIREAPAPKFTADAFWTLWFCIRSSWFPGGYHTLGLVDNLIADSWIAFLLLLFVAFFIVARPQKRLQAPGVWLLGCLFCSPALAVGHSYGLTLTALAFMTTISIAGMELYRRAAEAEHRKLGKYAVVSFLALGLVLGVGGGARRSAYVAETLHDNCALKILFDANFIFELYGRPTTVPKERRETTRARLAAIGISSVQDIRQVYERCAAYDAEYVRNRESRRALFLPKYAFGSY